MLALDGLPGLRVVADPAALDGATWQGDGVVVLRSAPDEAFAVGATDATIGDPHAIVEPEAGYTGAWLSADALQRLVLPHLEWTLPAARPVLAQGTIAGVPAKLWLTTDADGLDRALLVVQAAYADELSRRLR